MLIMTYKHKIIKLGFSFPEILKATRISFQEDLFDHPVQLKLVA